MARFFRLIVAAVCGAPILFGGFALRGEEKQPASKAAGQPASEPPAETPLPAPFKLTKQEQAEVDRALDGWKQATNQIKTYECNFTHWVYDSTFFPQAPGEEQKARSTAAGVMKCLGPDHWVIRETNVQTWTVDSTTSKLKTTGIKDGDHWGFDGKRIWKADDGEEGFTSGSRIDGQIDPAENPWTNCDFATRIVDSIPFAFGLRADKVKDRYYGRLITPKLTTDEVWLELVPKTRSEAASISRMEVTLNAKEMLPIAARISISENDREVYRFENRAYNDKVKPFGPDTFEPKPHKSVDRKPASPEPCKSY